MGRINLTGDSSRNSSSFNKAAFVNPSLFMISLVSVAFVDDVLIEV